MSTDDIDVERLGDGGYDCDSCGRAGSVYEDGCHGCQGDKSEQAAIAAQGCEFCDAGKGEICPRTCIDLQQRLEAEGEAWLRSLSCAGCGRILYALPWSGVGDSYWCETCRSIETMPWEVQQ